MATTPQMSLTSIHPVSPKLAIEQFSQKILSETELTEFAKNFPEELKKMADTTSDTHPETRIANFNLGSCYEFALLPEPGRLPRDLHPILYRSPKAREYHDFAQKCGLTEAQYKIGLYQISYQHNVYELIGFRTIKDMRLEGVELLKKAANAGDIRAQYHLALFLKKDLENHLHNIDHEDDDTMPPYPHAILFGDRPFQPGKTSVKAAEIRKYLKAAASKNHPEACVALGEFCLEHGIDPSDYFETDLIVGSRLNNTVETKLIKDQPQDLKSEKETVLIPKSTNFLPNPGLAAMFPQYLGMYWLEKAAELGSNEGKYLLLIQKIQFLFPQTQDSKLRVEQYQNALRELEQQESVFQFGSYKNMVTDLKLRIKLETCNFSDLSDTELEEIEKQAEDTGQLETRYCLALLYKQNHMIIERGLIKACEWLEKGADARHLKSCVQYAKWLEHALVIHSNRDQRRFKNTLIKYAADRGNMQAALQYALYLVNDYDTNKSYPKAYIAYTYFRIAERHGMKPPAKILDRLESILEKASIFKAIQNIKANLFKQVPQLFCDSQNRIMLEQALGSLKLSVINYVLEKFKVKEFLENLIQQEQSLENIPKSLLFLNILKENMLGVEKRTAFMMGFHSRLGAASDILKILNKQGKDAMFDRQNLPLIFQMADIWTRPSVTDSSKPPSPSATDRKDGDSETESDDEHELDNQEKAGKSKKVN